MQIGVIQQLGEFLAVTDDGRLGIAPVGRRVDAMNRPWPGAAGRDPPYFVEARGLRLWRDFGAAGGVPPYVFAVRREGGLASSDLARAIDAGFSGLRLLRTKSEGIAAIASLQSALGEP